MAREELDGVVHDCLATSVRISHRRGIVLSTSHAESFIDLIGFGKPSLIALCTPGATQSSLEVWSLRAINNLFNAMKHNHRGLVEVPVAREADELPSLQNCKNARHAPYIGRIIGRMAFTLF